MLFTHSRLPIRAALGSPYIGRTATLAPAAATTLQQTPAIVSANAIVQGQRSASVKAQGAYKLTSKKTIPKKLGAKRIGDQYVLPGTIIYKQRGTIWHAGENAILGRDHTIHAAVAGYVKYYRDANVHPDRQFIGVTYERGDVLPHSASSMQKRRLGMVLAPRKARTGVDLMSPSGIPTRVIRKEGWQTLEETAAAQAAAAATATKADQAQAVVRAAEAEAKAEAEAEVQAALAKDKKPVSKATLGARRWNAYVRIKRSQRVLYLNESDYSYRESNAQIGRLMGKHKGKTPGTQRLGSRHSTMRFRRRKMDAKLEAARKIKELGQKVARGGSGKQKKKAQSKSAAKKMAKKEAKKA